MLNPDNVKDKAYIYFGKKSDAKYPKFKVGDHVRISKYKSFFFIYLNLYLPLVYKSSRS